MEEALEKFAVYDKWGDIEYKFSVQVRYVNCNVFVFLWYIIPRR